MAIGVIVICFLVLSVSVDGKVTRNGRNADVKIVKSNQVGEFHYADDGSGQKQITSSNVNNNDVNSNKKSDSYQQNWSQENFNAEEPAQKEISNFKPPRVDNFSGYNYNMASEGQGIGEITQGNNSPQGNVGYPYQNPQNYPQPQSGVVNNGILDGLSPAPIRPNNFQPVGFQTNNRENAPPAYSYQYVTSHIQKIPKTNKAPNDNSNQENPQLVSQESDGYKYDTPASNSPQQNNGYNYDRPSDNVGEILTQQQVQQGSQNGLNQQSVQQVQIGPNGFSQQFASVSNQNIPAASNEEPAYSPRPANFHPHQNRFRFEPSAKKPQFAAYTTKPTTPRSVITFHRNQIDRIDENTSSKELPLYPPLGDYQSQVYEVMTNDLSVSMEPHALLQTNSRFYTAAEELQKILKTNKNISTSSDVRNIRNINYLN